MGFEDEAEQSYGRPYRQGNGWSKQTCKLTSAIVPQERTTVCSLSAFVNILDLRSVPLTWRIALKGNSPIRRHLILQDN